MFTTFSGLVVNPLDLRPQDVRIEDIAHHLACINRFCGALKWPVSVAQHSIWVSRLVPPEFALEGLLHDASEAYLGDVTKWVKQSDTMRGYRQAEARAQSVINRVFGLPEEMSPPVEEVDRLMVRYEGHRGLPNGIQTPHVERYGPLTDEEKRRVGPMHRWTWQCSEEVFLAEFRRLYHAERA